MKVICPKYKTCESKDCPHKKAHLYNMGCRGYVTPPCPMCIKNLSEERKEKLNEIENRG